MKHTILWGTAVALSLTLLAANTEKAFDYKLVPKKVASNLWCFFGAIEKPTKENAGNMVNTCYVKTEHGYWSIVSICSSGIQCYE